MFIFNFSHVRLSLDNKRLLTYLLRSIRLPSLLLRSGVTCMWTTCLWLLRGIANPRPHNHESITPLPGLHADRANAVSTRIFLWAARSSITVRRYVRHLAIGVASYLGPRMSIISGSCYRWRRAATDATTDTDRSECVHCKYEPVASVIALEYLRLSASGHLLSYPVPRRANFARYLQTAAAQFFELRQNCLIDNYAATKCLKLDAVAEIISNQQRSQKIFFPAEQL